MNVRRSSLAAVLALLIGLCGAGCAGASQTASPEGSVGASGASASPIGASGSPGTSASPSAVAGTVTGHLTAAPTCPVEAQPPASGCAPAPVADATVIATNSAGREVARAVSGADGAYTLDLAPGTYTLTPVPSVPMLRPPSGRSVTVPSSGPVVVDFVLDTGIR
jgi:hypothetical protein